MGAASPLPNGYRNIIIIIVNVFNNVLYTRLLHNFKKNVF